MEGAVLLIAVCTILHPTMYSAHLDYLIMYYLCTVQQKNYLTHFNIPLESGFSQLTTISN